jgi:hypothetical protein
MYFSTGGLCAELNPVYECKSGVWTKKSVPSATCPDEVPMGGSTCPSNVPCNNGIRSLTCTYGCVRATCSGTRWSIRLCDGGVDAADAKSDAKVDATSDATSSSDE